MGEKMPIPYGKILDLSAFVLFVEQRVVEDIEWLFGEQVIPERFKGAEKQKRRGIAEAAAIAFPVVNA